MGTFPKIGIVGAGPAGSAAAIMLAQRGIATTLFDKSAFPRDKICGDALSLDVINQLKWISPELSERFDQFTAKEASAGVSIFSPGSHRVDIPFERNGQKDRGYVSRRIDFDQLLLDQASSYSEVSFHPEESIREIEPCRDGLKLRSDKGEYDFDLLLGADGAQSVVARKLAGHKVQHAHHSAGVRQYYEGVKGFHEEGFIELYFFKDILPGYLWIFKLPNNAANVGIGMLSSAVRRKKIDLKKTLEELVRSHPSLKERFRNATAMEPPKGFGLPLGSTKRLISGQGFLLLGDAAGLIDPFSGEGIANALRSGRVAAEFIAASIASGNDFSAENNKAYDQEIWRRVWPELKLSSQLQTLCRYPRLFNMVCRKANANPEIHRFLVDALSEVSIKKQLTRPSFYWHLLIS